MPNSPNSPFTVAGMSSTSGAHSHGPPWGSSSTSGTLQLGASLADSFGQSRAHYQSGYMMSSAPSNALPQGSQRVDEVPTVQTKAKMNHALSRGAASDFGMESMFEKSRQRQNLADEDAPPMNSIYDIPNESYANPSSVRFQPRNSVTDTTLAFSRQTRPASTSTSAEIHYVIVFGYPPDKYSVTAEYFKSIGDTTEPDPNMQITNCFRIGYRDFGEAMRAVKRNGEILAGSYMVGAKWADQARANETLAQTVGRGLVSDTPVEPTSPSSMAVDEVPPTHALVSTPSYGTPIRLAPSAAAFRKPGQSPTQGQQRVVATRSAPPAVGLPSAVPVGQSPGKGMLGQVSDLIFGW